VLQGLNVGKIHYGMSKREYQNDCEAKWINMNVTEVNKKKANGKEVQSQT
jgi:hypothetical protein